MGVSVKHDALQIDGVLRCVQQVQILKGLREKKLSNLIFLGFFSTSLGRL